MVASPTGAGAGRISAKAGRVIKKPSPIISDFIFIIVCLILSQRFLVNLDDPDQRKITRFGSGINVQFHCTARERRQP
jgi:hypothetical protein